MQDRPLKYEFKKSTLCGGGECIEVAMLPSGKVAIRGTKPNKQEPLIFTRDEWTAFLAGAKAGEFDPPANK